MQTAIAALCCMSNAKNLSGPCLGSGRSVAHQIAFQAQEKTLVHVSGSHLARKDPGAPTNRVRYLVGIVGATADREPAAPRSERHDQTDPDRLSRLLAPCCESLCHTHVQTTTFASGDTGTFYFDRASLQAQLGSRIPMGKPSGAGGTSFSQDDPRSLEGSGTERMIENRYFCSAVVLVTEPNAIASIG